MKIGDYVVPLPRAEGDSRLYYDNKMLPLVGVPGKIEGHRKFGKENIFGVTFGDEYWEYYECWLRLATKKEIKVAKFIEQVKS